MALASGRFESVIDTIGRTPVVPLRRLGAGLPGEVWVKLESRNPGGSVKDRIGRGMIDDAESRGLIRRGESVLIEPTSGNTGIALALIGAARGYRVILTMPESMSIERRKLAAAFGAELVLTPRELGMKGAVDAANDLAELERHAFIPGQFDNFANPRSHYESTGPEIAAAFSDAELGAFVAGVGTGGTVSGVGRYLRDNSWGTKIVAVEPEESPLITQTLAGEPLSPAPHLIQGIGANFIPATLDLDVLDEVQRVSGAEAIETARRLAGEEGLLVGISSGAAVAAALRLAGREELRGQIVLTIAPSTGERYLSTPLWEGYGETA
jgi:cysteine synthase A